jgi:chitodextrinase
METKKAFIASLLVAVLGVGHAAGQPTVAPLIQGTYAFDGPVEKYVLFNPPTGISHAGGLMHWYYNDANRPAAVTKSAVLAQINASMAKWSAVCNISFSYQGETSTGFSSSDGTNVIGWTTTDLTAPTTGLTLVAWDGSNHIVDADIKLNAAYSATYSPSGNLDATITHEVGHSLGLNHSDVANQVMSGPPLTSYDGMTSLGSDDIAGCVHLYGGPGGGGGGPDTQAPSVPTGLVATPQSTTQINLAWNASTDNVGVTGYKVYSGGTFLGTVSATGAAVQGLNPGTTYSFTVSACDAAGNCSAQSASVSGTTQSADTQPPTVPSGLVATALNTSQISLSWNASSDNVGVTGYNVYSGATLLGNIGNVTSVTVQNLMPGTMYSFTVSACDAASNCSAQSAAASATTMSAPATCTGSQPANDQQMLACPAGQIGSITQTRSYSCVGTTWTPGAWSNVSNTCTSVTNPNPTNYQDMWWAGSTENGWGMTVTQHGDTLFLALYIYGASGAPMWVVLPSGTWDASHTTYSGNLYIPSGSSFSSYDVSRFAAGASVGTASITFDSSSTGTLNYVVNGVSGQKRMTRLSFGVVDGSPIASYGDMWWGGSAQNGWGLVLSQQYHNLFAAWYTYDAAGQTTWFVMPNGAWSGNTYSGALYRTRGTQVIGASYDATKLIVTQAGTLSITFTDTNTATMTYTVDGVTQTKSITRLGF